MQKLSSGYIVTKFILFSVFELIGACLSAMFLYVFKTSSLSAEIVRALAGGIGLMVFCVMTYRTVMTAKLDKITKGTYILGEGITAFVFLAITGAVCAALGKAALTKGFKTAVFLPMLPFSYLTKNLFLGLAIQLIFCVLLVLCCYEIKRKKDPTLLGRAKGVENK